MKAKLIEIREALEYSMGHIQSSIQFERNSPNCAYEARETTIKHHNDAIDAIGLVDELLAELDSPEMVERVAVAINRARVTRPMPNDLGQAAINAIKGE